MWAAGATCARKTVALTRDKGSAEVRLPAACSSAVHGCRLVMIRAAAPNLLQVSAGRRFHLRDVLLPNKVQCWLPVYCSNPAVSMLTEYTNCTAGKLCSVCPASSNGLDQLLCLMPIHAFTLDRDCLLDACKCVQSHTVS
jgi:hypothetical protein